MFVVKFKTEKADSPFTFKYFYSDYADNQI